MTTPRRYVNGVATRDANHPFGQFFEPDPTRLHGYFNDFYTYAATDWVLTTAEAGAGNATEVIADDEVGGVLTITNAGGSGDHDNFQLSKDGGTNDAEVFTFATQKKAWFDTRFKSNDGDQVTIHIGIHIVNTDPVNAAPTDGIYFKTTDETGDISLLVRKNSTETSAAGLGTLGDDTFVRLSYYWDGVDTIYGYVDGVEKTSLSSGNLPDDDYMALSFGVENGEAAANTLELDYIGAWMER
jgi:hypothetical protein